MSLLDEQLALTDRAATLEIRGRVSEVRGMALAVVDLPVPVGTMVGVQVENGRSAMLRGAVIGFDQHETLVMPLGSLEGVRRGDNVIADQFSQSVKVGHALIGRVIDGLGRPIDGKGPVIDTVSRPLEPDPVDPMDRPLIDTQLTTGVRAVDTMVSVGLGQRVGVFAAPGLGKSTLLGHHGSSHIRSGERRGACR